MTDDTTPGGNVRPLADDVQAKMYAWVEFLLDPDRLSVRADWVYVAKDTRAEWVVTHTFLRADTLAWFDRVIRPVIDAMLAARELNDAHALASNHESCQRCFVRNSCSPFAGAQTKENLVMALDLNRLRNRTVAQAGAEVALASREDLVVALGESIAAVAINRPRPVVDTTGVEAAEAPAIALREEMAEAIPKDQPAPVVTPAVTSGDLSAAMSAGGTGTVTESTDTPATAAPKRGRPRKASLTPGQPLPAPSPARTLAADVEDLASAVQSMRDLCDRIIGDLDKRIATLLAQTKAGA